MESNLQKLILVMNYPVDFGSLINIKRFNVHKGQRDFIQ